MTAAGIRSAAAPTARMWRDDVPVLRDYTFDDERALRADGH
jgi:hypothetical protein